MSQEIINVLNYISEKLGIAIDWTAANVWPQVMEILGQYRLYSIVVHAIGVVVPVIITIVLIGCYKIIIKEYKECVKSEMDNFFWEYFSYSKCAQPESMTILLFVFTGVFCIVGIFVFAYNVSELLKWAIIPEIQILELLQGYIQ